MKLPDALTNNEFPEALLPVLQRDAQEKLSLSQAPSLKVMRVLANPYSVVHVFQARTGDQARRIFVKQPFSEIQRKTTLQARLSAEFQIMDELQGGEEGEGGYSVAKPIGLYLEYPAIATLDGGDKTLRAHYAVFCRQWIPERFRQTLLEEVRQCGLWLRYFQDQTMVGTGDFDAKSLVEYISLRLLKLEEMGLLGATTSRSILERIALLSSKVDPAKHMVCGRHNDYAGHNIMVRKAGVCVIDFSMYDHGSFAFDPVNFWLELELLKLDVTYDIPFLSKLQKQFLSTFDRLEVNSPDFGLVRCQYMITRLLTAWPLSTGYTPLAYYHRKVVGLCLAWLLEFIQGKHQ